MRENGRPVRGVEVAAGRAVGRAAVRRRAGDRHQPQHARAAAGGALAQPRSCATAARTSRSPDRVRRRRATSCCPSRPTPRRSTARSRPSAARAAAAAARRRRRAGRRADPRRTHALRLGRRALRRRRPRQPTRRSRRSRRRPGRRRPGATPSACGLAARTSGRSTCWPPRRGGEFSAATSLADLARVYGRLGSRLAHQYVIRYRSHAPPGTPGRASTSGCAASPAARPPSTPRRRRARAAGPAVPPRPVERVWRAPGAPLLVVVFVAALVAVAACGAAAAAARLAARAHGGLRRAAGGGRRPARRAAPLTGRMLRQAPSARSSGRRVVAGRFQERLDVGADRDARRCGCVACVAAGTLLAGLAAPARRRHARVRPARARVPPFGAQLIVDRARATPAQAVRRPAAGQPAGHRVGACAPGHSFSGALPSSSRTRRSRRDASSSA